MLAFALNIANFNAVKEGGPLMMNVVGNVKQVSVFSEVLSAFWEACGIHLVSVWKEG